VVLGKSKNSLIDYCFLLDLRDIEETDIMHVQHGIGSFTEHDDIDCPLQIKGDICDSENLE
jgi:hypothetical protein